MSPTLALFALQAHEPGHLSDGGVLAEFAWLIPLVPLVLMVAIVFVGKRLPYKGWELAEAAMLFVAVYGVTLLIMNASGGIYHEGSVEIARIGAYTIEWGWVVDGLSIMMYSVVGVVGLAVFTYSKGYMKGDVRYTWFFAAFTLFAGAMLVLVSAANMIQLLVGWELVGLASYLLIGHYWEDHSNNAAAIKAF
ncbi:MAG: proton-conducting transporter membrane subunit, partial [Acidimicrobiia bacterium]